MSIEAKVIADSISSTGKRITTLQLKYPRFIHSELMTHRVFSRNASSSRAIPVKKMLSQVWNNPAMPIHWGANQAGMQAKEELSGWKYKAAKHLWKLAGKVACVFAWVLNNIKLHKQIANRILEPWQYIHVVVTATEWDNFFELRDHEDAQPEIRELALRMKRARNNSTPTLLKQGEWHLPYITHQDYSSAAQYLFKRGLPELDCWDPKYIAQVLRQVSAARCCRVSYLKHDNSKSTIEEDVLLCGRLAGAKPIHASPFEHQASPDELVINAGTSSSYWLNEHQHGNFDGWIQNRKLIEESFT